MFLWFSYGFPMVFPWFAHWDGVLPWLQGIQGSQVKHLQFAMENQQKFNRSINYFYGHV